MRFKCPHCHSPATLRTSRELTPLLREGYYQCSDVFCGHTFKVLTEVVKTISPASHPDPVIAAQLQRTENRRSEPGTPPTAVTRQHFARLEHTARCELARTLLTPRGD